MRRAISCALILVPLAAAAQTPPPMFPLRPPASMADRITERVGAQIGALMIENASLTARNEDLQAQVASLTRRIQELERAAAETPAKP
jgi:hypothetical protein